MGSADGVEELGKGEIGHGTVPFRRCPADLRLWGTAGKAGATSSAAWPPLTQASTSDAKNFHKRPSL
jgi:hypothetical protein